MLNVDEHQQDEQKEEEETLADKLARALNQLVHGKRSLLIRDYTSAVESLDTACQLFDEIYGTNSDECGDVYLFYGVARLELARLETGAFDGVVNADIKQSSDEEDDDEVDDEVDEDEQAEVDENEDKNGIDKENEKSPEEKEVNKEDKDEDIEDLDESQEKSSAIEESTAGTSSKSEDNDDLKENCRPSTSTGIVKKPEEEEPDATDMEIAWDSLNAAASIFRRRMNESKEIKLKLAEALQKLGEISIEWENNEHSLNLLEESLSLRKECLADDDRLIAETYYHIGIAFSFMSQVEKANDCYRSVISVIEKKIESNKELIKNTDNLDEKDKAEKEVFELKEILKDMAAKIEDSQDQMRTIKDAMKISELERLDEEAVASKIKEVQSKPVTNITHLVKRKRPSDTEVDNSSTVSKKLCEENN